jgi:hypothetical protein
MKIYIPTLGRHNKQIAYDNLPNFIQEKTVLVVQPHEKHLYSDYPILVLPKDDIGISRTRKWIIDNNKDNLFGMMDDDLIFKKRFQESPTKRDMTDQDWHEFLNTTTKWLEDDVSFVGLRRGYLPPIWNSKKYIRNSETICCTFYNKEKLPNSDELIWNHDLFCSDVNLHMQYLLLGHQNKTWTEYCYIAEWGQQGGCQAGKNPRTLNLMNESHAKLVEQYPNFVKWSGKTMKHNGKFKGAKTIRCYYSNAFKKGGKNVVR